MAEGEPEVTAVDVLDGNGHLSEREREGYAPLPTPSRGGSFVPPRGPAQLHVLPRCVASQGPRAPTRCSPGPETPWETRWHHAEAEPTRGPHGYSQASEFPSHRRGPAPAGGKLSCCDLWWKEKDVVHAALKQRVLILTSNICIQPPAGPGVVFGPWAGELGFTTRRHDAL